MQRVEQPIKVSTLVSMERTGKTELNSCLGNLRTSKNSTSKLKDICFVPISLLRTEPRAQM